MKDNLRRILIIVIIINGQREPGSETVQTSRLTIVRLAALENLPTGESMEYRLNDDVAASSKPLEAFAKVVKAVASDKDPNRLIRYR